MGGHAYGVVDIFTLGNPEKAGGKRNFHRLLAIRNPWGYGEWLGNWGDKSEQVELWGELLNDYLNLKEDKDENFKPGVEDGTFLMNFKNFRKVFNNMFVCVDFKDNWTGLRFFSEWTTKESWGVASNKNPASMTEYAKNPQYLIDNTIEGGVDEVELFISLAQEDGRGQMIDGIGLKFPYVEVIKPAVMVLFRLTEGKSKLESFDGPNIIK